MASFPAASTSKANSSPGIATKKCETAFRLAGLTPRQPFLYINPTRLLLRAAAPIGSDARQLIFAQVKIAGLRFRPKAPENHLPHHPNVPTRKALRLQA